MPVNSSFSNFSLHSQTNTCFGSNMSIFVFSAVFINNLLLLPVCILVLYLGYQQWRQQRLMSVTATSHSDLLTYHAIAMQLNEFLGFSLLFGGGYITSSKMVLVGRSLMKVTSTGQPLFHTLICVEHYLAVVHPITYLHLRQASEVRIRNISIGCVWLLSFGRMVVYLVGSNKLNWTLYFCIMGFELVVIFFCNVSVLCALKRPGPGDKVGNKEQVDQSKKRAFYTIFAIMGVLLFRFVGNVSGNVIYNSSVVSHSNYCLVLMSTVWLDLPSSLVLPLLFLHRAGKLQCCKQHSESC